MSKGLVAKKLHSKDNKWFQKLGTTKEDGKEWWKIN